MMTRLSTGAGEARGRTEQFGEIENRDTSMAEEGEHFLLHY